MRRVVSLLLVLCVVLAGCQQAAPEPEVITKIETKVIERVVEKPVEKIVEKTEYVNVRPATIVWLTEASPIPAYFIAQQYLEVTNGAVDVQVLLTNSPDGSTAEMDAMFAAGDPPHVYSAYGGRTGKFYDECIPLDLEEDKYVPGMLDLVRNSAGEIVGVPYYYWVQAGGVNMDLVRKYGLNPANLPSGADKTWTIAQYEALCTEFHEKSTEDEFCGMAFASGGGGDYWLQMLEVGLGAHPLYDESGALDVGALRTAWTRFQEYIDKGWFPEGPEGLTAIMFASAKGEGKLLFSFSTPTQSTTFDICSYPSLDGSFVPFAIAPTVHVGIKSYDVEQDAATKAFVEWLNEAAQHQVLVTSWATRIDVDGQYDMGTDLTDEELAKKQHEYDWMVDSLAEHGVIDIGIGSIKYAEIRALRVEMLARFFSGEDIDAVLAEFQSRGNAILNE